MSHSSHSSKGFLRMGSTKGIKDTDFILVTYFMLLVILTGFYICA